MNYVQTITTIRGRGQLTVPHEVRKVLKWPDGDIVVKVESTKSGFKVERLPISHPQNPVKSLTDREWDNLLGQIEAVSSSGKRNTNLTKVLREDRNKHF